MSAVPESFLPRWLHGMVVPTVTLWVCALVSALVPLLAGSALHADEAPRNLLRIALAVAISIWVTADARKRRRSLPYDYDSFMFFAWPVLGPFYLWQTRRWRAALTLAWFFLLLLFASAGDIARALSG